MLDIQKMIANRCNVPLADQALADRTNIIDPPAKHQIFDNHPTELAERLSSGTLEQIQFGLGCFWGAERKFWQEEGVIYTAVGYAGGHTQNATYEDVCSGKTGHAEVVWIVFDSEKTNLERMLAVFWESHDPTQGMRQGNDVGTQYRSAIYHYSATQLKLIENTKHRYQNALASNDLSDITTEIASAPPFYFAEPYHQQYLYKNPKGYCGLGGTGVSLSKC